MASLTLQEVLESLEPQARDEVNKSDFLEPLNLFLDGLNKMTLTTENKRAMLEKVREHAIHRADVHNAIVKNPDVLKTPVNPVVIIGLARTGTTMLQRLLASAPQFVSPMTWEVMHPCPPGRPKNWIECDRYQRAKDTLEKMFPDGFDEIQRKHEVKLEIPEECMYIIQAYFLDIGLTILPTMEKWKDYSFHPPKQNLRSAYEYYKKTLQCIFYQNLTDGKLPLLKAPVHTLYLDMYREIFPDAKFIFPYRNAREMIGSGCSIFGEISTTFGFECDKADVKRYTLEYYKLASSNVVKTLKDMPQESFFTISYSEMVKDPLAAVKNLFSHFGLEMTPETEKAMQNHMMENQQHKLGEHKYSLEEYGITEDEVRENLAEFLDYFGKNENLL